MNTISCLFLDIGGVLLSNGWSHELRQRAVENFNLDPTEMEERHHLIFAAYEEGRITFDEYLDRVIFYAKRDFSRSDFKEFMYAQSKPDLNMIGMIKSLKLQYKLKIIAVSNESRELNAYRINTFKLYEIFDFFISSCYVHVRKPDSTILRLAMDGSQVPIEKILYIDDVQMFVDVASGMGISSIHHTDYESTKNALAEFGLRSLSEIHKDHPIHSKTNPAKFIIGIASDHGGFDLKEQLVSLLKSAGYEVIDFGAYQLNTDDDYPDFVIPLSTALAQGEVTRGIAICGSGVGASIAANKIEGVRSALITDSFSAHQGVEDDDMNMMCLGGRVTGSSQAWELVQKFINARFKKEERFIRRLQKVELVNRNIDI